MYKIKINKHIAAFASALAIALVPFATPAAAQQEQAVAKVRASVDSAAVTMSDRVVLHVEVLKTAGKGTLVGLPAFEPGKPNDFHGAEVRDITADSTALPNGRMQVNYQILLQPFDPGVLTFPAFKYAIDADTFYSEVTTLKVLEPEMPKMMRDSLIINPMEGTVSIPARWYDFIPSWWYWVLIAAAVIALGVVIYMLYKKNGPSLLPRRKVVPPYELAVDRLQKLKARKLTENGHDKEYNTELTDILREYLQGRFGIYAREMTSTQILQAVTDNAETAPFADEFRAMLETADFVKFAKQRPTPDENQRSFATVSGFVEKTKPVEEEEDEKAAKGKKGKKVRKARKGNKKK